MTENHGWPKFVNETYCRNFIRSIHKAGANFNARNKMGLTPLLCHLFSSSSPDKFIFESLISKGADMYVLNPSSKKSILSYIIENSLIELLEVVLKENYDVNRPESNGDAPIFSCLLGNHLICSFYCLVFLRFLLLYYVIWKRSKSILSRLSKCVVVY